VAATMNIYEGAMQKFAKEEEVVCQFAKLLPIVLVPSEFENLLTAIETE
jgi:hypothetical protein